MKVIFEKTSAINVLPNITFVKIGKIFYITFAIYKYMVLFKFGKTIFDE